MKRRGASILNASFATRRRALTSASLVLVLALLLPTSAYAIFGLGDIVYDPTNYAEAVQQLDQDIQIVSQVIQTYNLLKSELAIITNRPWQTLATTLASIQIADLGDAPSAAA